VVLTNSCQARSCTRLPTSNLELYVYQTTDCATDNHDIYSDIFPTMHYALTSISISFGYQLNNCNVTLKAPSLSVVSRARPALPVILKIYGVEIVFSAQVVLVLPGGDSPRLSFPLLCLLQSLWVILGFPLLVFILLNLTLLFNKLKKLKKLNCNRKVIIDLKCCYIKIR
jgi:hypothetical protein